MEGGHPYQDTVAVPARHAHSATVIFIHGLGQSNLTWRMVVIEALAPKLPHVQWILPQAPKRHVSMNHRHRRPSWFDVAQLPPGQNEFDENAISESIGVIEDLILSQVHAGIDSRRIVLVGFSQGAALSMMVALSSLHYLGGVVSLSGWIPPRARYMMHATPSLPVLWCHGAADREIPISYGQDATTFLRNTIGLSPSKLQIRVYDDLGHAINDAELDDIASWLQFILR
ncbi:phospholipase carboxylesterase [Lyophyllum atratum]|nr:phospholipase carboxylesterase [Lyophyllum atratum]